MPRAANVSKEPTLPNFCAAAKVRFWEAGKLNVDTTALSRPWPHLQVAAVATHISAVRYVRNIWVMAELTHRGLFDLHCRCANVRIRPMQHLAFLGNEWPHWGRFRLSAG